MSGITETTSPISKRSTSPRPPAVGEEVKKFHDTSQYIPEPYKNWNMECQSKAYSGETVHRSVTPTCTENVTESAECTENSPNPSPPASYKWAQSLHCLLEDIQGVSLFQKFLKQEGQDTRCLSFWFACRGVKKNDPCDRDSLIKLIKVVFEKKVKRISAISDETKEEIRQKLVSNSNIDDTIFDAAQREVESYMMKTTYPNFLRSDLYIQHLGGWQNELSPEKEPVVSPEPLDLLPTVHEDAELHIASNKIPLTKTNLLQRNKISSVSKLKPEGPVGFLRSPYSNYSSYHSKYGSYLPASAQDSELQSLSSDAQTDDTMSLTDSNA
jgi:axin 1